MLLRVFLLSIIGSMRMILMFSRYHILISNIVSVYQVDTFHLFTHHSSQSLSAQLHLSNVTLSWKYPTHHNDNVWILQIQNDTNRCSMGCETLQVRKFSNRTFYSRSVMGCECNVGRCMVRVGWTCLTIRWFNRCCGIKICPCLDFGQSVC